MLPPPWRAAFAACAILSFGNEASAGDPGALDLRTALARAVEHRPELRGFEFRLKEGEAGQARAALRRPYELEVLVEDALGTGAHSGMKSAQTTLLLSHVLEFGGKRERRRELADSTVAALMTDRAVEQLDVAAGVARRFVEVLRGEARHSLAQEGLRLAELTRDRVRQRVQAARSPLAEAARADVAVIDARVALEDTEHDLEIARHQLAAAMGERSVDFGQARGDLGNVPPIPPLDELLAGLESSPDLLRFADRTRVAEAELRLTQLQARADVRASLGLRRLEQSDDLALVAGVSMPLFAGGRARPDIDAARARRDRMDADRETAYLRLQAQLHAAYLQMEHARVLAGTLKDDLLPRVQQALELTSDAYERGRYSYLELAAAQRALLEARVRLLENLADFHLLRIEIERLSARSIDADGVSP